MKHGESTPDDVSRETPIEPDVLTAWLGIGLDLRQTDLLVRYEQWLATEAVVAGGIGPDETTKLRDRHTRDSLAFVRGIPADATSIVDIGSGVGLPGIPLAIALPAVAVTLVDRSGRRIDLARRAVRVLGLHNVEVRQADVDHLQGAWDVVTFRASLPVPAAAAAFERIGAPSGVGLLGLSRQADPPHVPDPPAGIAFTVADVAEGRLDSPFWLLTMRRSS